MTPAARAGTDIVILILFAIAVYLWYQAAVWCGERIALEERRSENRSRQKIFLAIADYLDEAQRPINSAPTGIRRERAFALDPDFTEPPRAA